MPTTLRDGVAVVTLDNPPVNALGPASIAPLMQALDEAEADPAARAIVLTGANGTFSGGADMKGFAGARTGPTIRDLIERLEAGTKPVVAAVAGNCLGGGFEVALGCDYRVAAPDAQLAFPEIKRGLLPGAGGTQRAPRLAGVEAALPLILGGDPVDARRAQAIGLVDEVAEGDVLEAAVRFAAGLAPGSRRRASDLRASGGEDALAAARRKAAPEARGGLAEQRALDCVEDALAAAVRRGHGARARAVRRAGRLRAVAGPHPPLLRRARGRQAARRLDPAQVAPSAAPPSSAAARWAPGSR